MSSRLLLKILASAPIVGCCLMASLLTGAMIALSVVLFLPIAFGEQSNSQLTCWLHYLSPQQRTELRQKQQLPNYRMQIQRILQDSKRYSTIPVHWVAELAYLDVMHLNPFIWAE